jgi:flagellum-specific peptidoglycan hydrolase FlgJ
VVSVGCQVGGQQIVGSQRTTTRWDKLSTDHGKQLSTLPRYATAMKYAASADRFATEIHKAGYATSPTYAKNLIFIMKQFKLYKFDGLSGRT